VAAIPGGYGEPSQPGHKYETSPRPSTDWGIIANTARFSCRGCWILNYAEIEGGY
jgi:hypothetical protein